MLFYIMYHLYILLIFPILLLKGCSVIVGQYATLHAAPL